MSLNCNKILKNIIFKNLPRIVFAVGFMINALLVTAQTSKIDIRFVQDTLTVKPGETFSNFLAFKNKSDREIVLRKYKDNANENALLKLPDSIVLAGGEIKQVPIKFFANQNTIKSTSQDFSTSYYNVDSSDRNIYATQFIVLLDAKSGLLLETPYNELYLRQFSSSAELELRTINSGLVPLSFKLEFEDVPKGLRFDFDNNEIVLEPGQNQLIQINATNVGAPSNTADFAVKIKAIDPHGKLIAQKNIRIMSLSHNRNLVMRYQDIYSNRPNVLSLNFINANNFSSVQLAGSGRYQWETKKEWGYNLNLNSYLKNESKYNLSDTYVYLKTRRWYVHLGSVNENYGFNVSGKGGKLSYNLDKNKTVGITAIDNDNMLLTDNHLWKRGGYTLAATYRDATAERENLEMVLLNAQEDYSQLNTSLYTIKKNLIHKMGHWLTADAGVSYQTTSKMNKQQELGYTLGLNYRWKSAVDNNTAGNLSVFYGSPYYGGFNRGLFVFNGNGSMRISDKESLSASVRFQSNKPKFLNTTLTNISFGRSNYSEQQNYELGYRVKLSEQLRVGMYPYYMYQSMASQIAADKEPQITDWMSKSYRAKLLFNLHHMDHSMSLSTDHGYTSENTSGRPTAPFYSLKTDFSYSFKQWGLTAYYQRNPYYLSDALVNVGKKEYDVFTIGPTGAFVGLENKLSVNYSLMYNYYGYNKSENYMLNIYGRWNVKNDWAFTASVNYGVNKYTLMTRYNPETGINYEDPIIHWGDKDLYTSRQIRIGVEKKLGRERNSSVRKLTYICFDDQNRNGIRDKGEPLLSDILLSINDLSAVSNKRGEVNFNGTVGDTYTPEISNMEGWTLLQGANSSVLLSKNRKHPLPLVKTNRITGEVKVIQNEYIREGIVNMSGIQILAISVDDENVRFQTSTNNVGAFNLYLPEAKYKIYADVSRLPLHIENNEQHISVVKSIEKQYLIFTSKDMRRSVEIKKL